MARAISRRLIAASETGTVGEPCPPYLLTRRWPSMDEIFPKQVEPTITGTIFPNRIPVQGTIRRCEHGVYIGANDVDDKAAYCQQCTPGGPADQRSIVLPRYSDIQLTHEGRTLANGNGNNGGCPQCGSVVYTRANERNATLRECAECGTHYRRRLSFNEQVAHARAAAQEEEQ